MKVAKAIWFGGILFVLCTATAHAGAAGGGGEADSNIEAPQPTGAALPEIRDRAESMPIDQRKDIDKRIGITVERVNKDATARGQTTVAGRLATEFGVTTEALLDQKGEHGLSWGELVIAYTLLANSKEKVTLLDLLSLRSDGLSWGAVAFGLRFHMEDLEDAIKAEGRVAMGLSKPDGKPAVIEK